MATKIFKIPTLNGFRWTEETFVPTPGYNSLPPEQEIDYTSYAAPIQKNDTEFPALICLSDYPDMLLEFINSDTQAVIDTPALIPTASSLIGQTFLQYLAVVNFSAFPTGWCFGRVSYDSNPAAQISCLLNELVSPFIDGNIQAKVDGTIVVNIVVSDPSPTVVSATQGLSYSFEAYAVLISSALNPRIRLTVSKTVNGVTTVIFDKSEVQTDTSSIVYTGILQPGAKYSAIVKTEDTAVVVAPINISDNTPVIPNIKSWITCPIDVQEEHPETMLVQYQNSENDNDVLWTPGNIILKMRVESNMVGGYQPKSVRESFEDQRYDPTLLHGIEFDVYTLYILGAGGPDWIIKKLNHIFANCDQVKIDYKFYVCTNGNEFKLTRPNGTWDREAMAEIDLQIVPDFEFGQLTAGTVPQGDLVVIRKVWPPLAVQAAIAASFSVVGIFTVNSTIDYLQVFNFGFDTFDLKLGTTPGANDIRQLRIGEPNPDTSIDLMGVYNVGVPFDESTTVYVTVPDGVNLKVLFVYDQLDSPVLNPVIPVGTNLPQGTVTFYKELVAGYFTRDWDIATGFGQAGSLYEGCQILDQASGKVLQAWNRLNNDVTNPDGSRGVPGVGGANEIGAGAGGITTGNEINIPKVALPAEGLNMFTTDVNNTNGDTPGPDDAVARAASDGHPLSYEIRRGVSAPATLGLTAPMGAGASLSIQNDGLIMLCYVKL